MATWIISNDTPCSAAAAIARARLASVIGAPPELATLDTALEPSMW